MAPAAGPLSSRATAAVVGGGPAGLMAAEVLAASGAEVTVYERMPSLGRKLQLAGRGGLNLTHGEAPAALLDRYGPARSRLAPAIATFGQDDLRRWCAGIGQETFVGTSGRVFPTELRATGLLRAWLRRLDASGVRFALRTTWVGWDGPGRIRLRFADEQERVVAVDVAVLALGGASWPRVGSDGAWVEVVRAAGIAVSPLRPANCGFLVDWSPRFATRFAGTPLKNVALSAAGRQVRGEAVVTATGIEGGAVYALSAWLREAIDRDGAVTLQVDLQPDLDVGRLAARLARARPTDSLSTRLRRARLAPVAGGLLREATGNLPPTGPDALAAALKAVPVHLVGLQPLARAISTAGGIALAEVDDSFMLRARSGTFVAGEMLDWEAPTGGYLLQASFSTGMAAGAGASRWLAERHGVP